jgi:hypothetical protein
MRRRPPLAIGCRIRLPGEGEGARSAGMRPARGSDPGLAAVIKSGRRRFSPDVLSRPSPVPLIAGQIRRRDLRAAARSDGEGAWTTSWTLARPGSRVSPPGPHRWPAVSCRTPGRRWLPRSEPILVHSSQNPFLGISQRKILKWRLISGSERQPNSLDYGEDFILSPDQHVVPITR